MCVMFANFAGITKGGPEQPYDPKAMTIVDFAHWFAGTVVDHRPSQEDAATIYRNTRAERAKANIEARKAWREQYGD